MKKQNCGKGKKRRQLANKEGRRNYVEEGGSLLVTLREGEKKEGKWQKGKKGKERGSAMFGPSPCTL